MNNKTIDFYVRDARNNHYNIRSIIRDRMSYEFGILKTAYVFRRFNKLYDFKHKDEIKSFTYEGLKTYTLARYISRFYLDKKQ